MDQAFPSTRPVIQAMQASQIRQVSVAGALLPDVIPLWFGESDQVTDQRIIEAAKRGLDKGDVFYAPNNGNDALRLALSRYQTGLSGRPVALDRITVTVSGMQGIMLSMQAVIDPGDHVLVVGPSWPNIPGAAKILSADVEMVNCTMSHAGWVLDVDALFTKVTDKTKAIVINSPNNPTGWMLTSDEWGIIVKRARENGLWIIADEVYARLAYDHNVAPSVLEHCEDEDRIIAVNSFSKSWTMTGWRLGWIVAPLSLKDRLGMITEFNVACAPGFVQAAGVAALTHSDSILEATLPRLIGNRALIEGAVKEWDQVSMAPIRATFYAFVKIEGMRDSLQTALNMLEDTRVGVAPGIAFGDCGEGYLRLCFANDTDRFKQALSRLNDYFLSKNHRIM